jgi:hypothetical protein
MKFLLISLFFYLVSSIAVAQDAAFGLKWGMSKELVEKTGLVLTRTGGEGNIEIYRSTSVPVPLSIGETYSLSFHKSWGLQRLNMISKKIRNDPTGRESKEQYSNLKSALIEKYGNPKQINEIFGNRLYKEFDEFYLCLRYTGCGMWSTLWDEKLDVRGSILVEIKGLSRSDGYIRLGYEGPKWSDAIDEHNSNKSTNDRKGL